MASFFSEKKGCHPLEKAVKKAPLSFFLPSKRSNQRGQDKYPR